MGRSEMNWGEVERGVNMNENFFIISVTYFRISASLKSAVT
jgi:hypothetical protein